MLAAYDDKSAYAQCIFAYRKGKDSEVKLFVGKTFGTLSFMSFMHRLRAYSLLA
jgi:hypothetical protein